MRNDFVLIGPPADPARARAAADIIDGLRRIALEEALFLSRGDSSGTHRKELALWRLANVAPEGDWYREAGIGQGDLIRMASERAGYAIVDRGTFRSLERAVDLIVLQERGAPLENPYSVIVATRAPHPDGAAALAAWLSGPRARAIIAAHGARAFGSPLFEPVEQQSMPGEAADSPAARPAATTFELPGS